MVSEADNSIILGLTCITVRRVVCIAITQQLTKLPLHGFDVVMPWRIIECSIHLLHDLFEITFLFFSQAQVVPWLSEYNLCWLNLWAKNSISYQQRFQLIDLEDKSFAILSILFQNDFLLLQKCCILWLLQAKLTPKK